MKKSYLILLTLCISVATYGQNTRSTGGVSPLRAEYLESKKAQEKKGFLSFLKKKEKISPYYSTRSEEIKNFRSRLETVQEEKEKQKKLAEKPQYSDPLYFGHKRPPKKRPVGKWKFCKECKMKH